MLNTRVPQHGMRASWASCHPTQTPLVQIYGVHHQLWRKSSQWFGLMRKHAEAVMQDKNVYNA